MLPSLELLFHEIRVEKTFLVNYIAKHLPGGQLPTHSWARNQTGEKKLGTDGWILTDSGKYMSGLV